MKKPLLITILCFIILAALGGMALVGLAIAIAPSPVSVEAQSVSTDTASIYFSDLYQGEGEYPLHTWQSITVYGETFPACVVEVLNGRSTFTVNPQTSLVCGQR